MAWERVCRAGPPSFTTSQPIRPPRMRKLAIFQYRRVPFAFAAASVSCARSGLAAKASATRYRFMAFILGGLPSQNGVGDLRGEDVALGVKAFARSIGFGGEREFHGG